MAATIQTIETPKRWRAQDTSGNNNHGQIYSGRGLEFDGVSDYFQHNGGTAISNVNQFNDEVAWTFACWLYQDTTSSTDYFVGRDGNSNPHLGFGGNQKLIIRAQGAGYFHLGQTELPLNTWYRVVIVASEAETAGNPVITTYVNGVQYGVLTGSDSPYSGSGDFNSNSGSMMYFTGWGAPYETGGARGHHYVGRMSDGQVWDTAWTADDVAFDYANPEQLALNRGGTSLTESNLKLWYPMNDGHRGQQSYVLDASNTGLGDNLVGNQSMVDSDGDGTPDGWVMWQTLGASYTDTEDRATFSIPEPGVLRVTDDLYGGDGNNGTSASDARGKSPHYRFTYGEDGTSYKINFKIRGSFNSSGDVVYIRGYSASSSWGWPPVALTTDWVEHTLYINKTTHSDFDDANAGISIYIGGGNIWHMRTDGQPSNTWMELKEVGVYPVNDKNHATTVFYGDEMIADAKNQGMTGTPDWDVHDPEGGSGVAVDINPTGGDTPNAAGRMRVTTTTDNEIEGAKLPVANLTAPVVGRTYRITAALDALAGDTTPTIIASFGGATASNAIDVNESDYNFDIVAANTTGDLMFYTDSATQSTFTVDDVTVKEIGVASGWTDADQQLDIPQTALQSYNQLAWFPGADPGVDYEVEVDKDAAIDDIWDGGGTASAWIYPVDAGAGGAARVLDKDKWIIYLTSAGTKISYTFKHDTADATGITTNAVLSVGEWSHIVVTYDDDSPATPPKIYVNGESVAVTENSPEGDGAYTTDSGNDFFIGNKENGSRTFHGCITEISMWKEVLTQSEVNNLYNDGKALDLVNEYVGDNLAATFINGTSQPFDTFSSSGNNISAAIDANTGAKQGCASETGFSCSVGEKFQIDFDITINSYTGGGVSVGLAGAASGEGTNRSTAVNYTESQTVSAIITCTSADDAAHLEFASQAPADGSGLVNFSASNIRLYRLPTGYWRNNGLATWNDLSENSNNGTVTNLTETILQQAGVDASRDCQGFLMNRQKDTNALNLAGPANFEGGTTGGESLDIVSSVQVADSESFDHDDGSNSKFSISVWFKANDYGNLPNDQTIVSKYDTNGNQREWWLHLDDDSTTNIDFKCSTNGISGDLTYNLGQLTDTDWHHIVVTYDGTQISGDEVVAYLDGGSAIDESDPDATARIKAGTAPVRIGDITNSSVAGGSYGLEFDGQIDDFCYYNRKILSRDEAKRNYNAGKRSHK